jgi:hypothetical protein
MGVIWNNVWCSWHCLTCHNSAPPQYSMTRDYSKQSAPRGSQCQRAPKYVPSTNTTDERTHWGNVHRSVGPRASVALRCHHHRITHKNARAQVRRIDSTTWTKTNQWHCPFYHHHLAINTHTHRCKDLTTPREPRLANDAFHMTLTDYF